MPEDNNNKDQSKQSTTDKAIGKIIKAKAEAHQKKVDESVSKVLAAKEVFDNETLNLRNLIQESDEIANLKEELTDAISK